MSIACLPPNYKWVVLGITTIGVLMVSIDTTVVILAFPDIMIDLNSNLISMIWVLMAYIFASTVLLLALGRVADIYGRVRLYNLGFALFTVGSGLCGLSHTDWLLIASRVVQGVGGALMLVNAWAILTEVFPPTQRGMAMGMNSMTFGVGSIAGPLLGGAILAVASWRWIFLINLPIGIVGTVVAYRYLREMSPPHSGETLDVVGSVSFSVALFALLFALTQGIELGFTSPIILAAFGVVIAALCFFVFWERHARHPALDLSLFRNAQFDYALLAATFQSLAVFAVQFLVVFYLQAVRGNSPLSAAILLLPMPAALVIFGPIGGRLADRIGPSIPATAGLLVQALGIYWLSTITPDSSYNDIAIGLALTGLGGGLFYSPNTSAAMSAAPRNHLGVAAATLATLRNLGMVTSYALALATAAGSLPRDVMLQLFVGTTKHLGTNLMAAFVDGMEVALRWSFVLCLATAAVSLLRSMRDAGH